MAERMRLAGRTAVITGAANGIGRAIAVSLARPRIVNLSSIYGVIAPPEQTAYSASRFAVRGFSEALRHELEGSHIGVTVVHPGGITTSIAENARTPAGTTDEEIAQRRAKYRKLLRLPPEIAGEAIVRGIERREARILIGSDAKTISLIARCLPVSYWKVLIRLVGE